jgi:hypothetical protein
MKQLMIILLLISSVQLNAQTPEPTKEETIKYIDGWLKQNIEGKAAQGNPMVSHIDFTGIQLTLIIPSSDPKISHTYYYTGMDWASYTDCMFDEWGSNIVFSKKNIKDEEGKYTNVVTLSGPAIPKDNQKQLLKACEHLKRLASQGNKNSYFDN